MISLLVLSKSVEIEQYADSGRFVIKLTCLVAPALPACGGTCDADTQAMQQPILQVLPEFAG